MVVVGKPSKEYAPIIQEYEKRLPKYCRFEVFEVKREADISGKLKGLTVMLDVLGKEVSSHGLLAMLKPEGQVTFVIGGAEGLSEATKKKADSLLSLSKMTLPHQLARLVLTEQIYRAFTLLKGEKYHK